MTMLSAQPITLTGEQHNRLRQMTRAIRTGASNVRSIGQACETLGLSQAVEVLDNAVGAQGLIADEIERILIDAQDAAPPAVTAGDAA